MPGWQLGLAWNDEQLVNATARGKIAAYMLTGLLAVAIAAGLALWIALRFLRQMRLTRLKNDLVATVSHELKTPLASIRLLVDTLLAADEARGTEEVVGEHVPKLRKFHRQPPPSPYVRRRASRPEACPRVPGTDRQGERPAEPVDRQLPDVFADGAEQAGVLRSIRSSRRPLSRRRPTRSASGSSRPAAASRSSVEPDLPPVTADADAMTTALVNLLDNAWKYSDGDKQITLRAYGDDGGVCFAVSDNGIGLSRAACKRVFERFYQVDRELSRSRGGCGLGLSIVEFIVEGHGGTRERPQPAGQGSTFTIALPCRHTRLFFSSA